MPEQSGYFSWICFIDVQRGAWFGPITQDQIDDYEYGFALDDNIKSWTRFQYFTQKPTSPLTCNFNKRIDSNESTSPKTVTYADCLSSSCTIASDRILKPHPSGATKGTARLLLYNKTGASLFATLSEHDGRLEVPGRPNWAQWRFIDEYPDHAFLLKVFEGNTRVYSLDLRPVGRDIHITFYENSQGYYHRFEEPW